MMRLRQWLAVLVTAIWLSAMVCALSQTIFSLDLLRVTEPVVCPAGTEMDVQTPRYSYDRPGETSIEITCVGSDVAKDVTWQAELVYWSICLLPSLPVAAIGTILVSRWWQSRRARLIGRMGSLVGRMSDSTLIVDGQTIDSVQDLPPSARQAYEKAMQVLVDENQDGIPDILEGVVQGGAQVIDLRQAATGSGVERLRELKEMLDGGLITQWEYEEKKREILEEM